MTPAGTPPLNPTPAILPPCVLRDGWWLAANPRPGSWGPTAVILPFKPRNTAAP
ncbi:hypothetical protein [Nitrospirillum sp. BR 11163]|uniref:hypothetical protein n=1 Tax=Nitrospirillum sp. BR 11163 TaxID=3104323 RepID=UPI002AFF4DB4|nr:hypothetical protein [Nitrospirillum sp. BR 11163]MEA1672579.1 hypothetical protein [Nitrospirillum sp. BR 11163]